MKRNIEPAVNELEGSVKLGMTREALKLARRALKRTDIIAVEIPMPPRAFDFRPRQFV